MLNILIAVVVYECLVALAFILCWRLVRDVDTRLPILTTDGHDMRHRSGTLAAGSQVPDRPGALWQVLALLLGAVALGGVALSLSGALADLSNALSAADTVAPDGRIDPTLLKLALPVGQLAILLALFPRFRNAVQFPAIIVHLFLIVFCLLVTLLDPARIETGKPTLAPIFATNLVLLVLTHGLLTLLFCRNWRELVGSVLLAALAGGILALGSMAIALISSLLGGPLFFFQLYLVSAFGIFGLYFCVTGILLALWDRN